MTAVEESALNMSPRVKVQARLLEEAPLYFGSGAKDIDPKRGLSIHGPFDKTSGDPQTIRLGIVSTSEGIQNVTSWADSFNLNPIESRGNAPFTTQTFPGFVSAFHCRLVLSEDYNETIITREVQNLLDLVNPNQRIRKTSELYASKVGIVSRRVNVPDVILCHEPSDIETRCGAGLSSHEKRKGALTADEKKEAERIRKDVSAYRILAPLNEDTLTLLDMSVNQDFRALLKAKCLEYDIPTQILTQSTLDEMAKTHRQTVKQRYRTQDPSTIAWNLAVALYYKANHFPWRVGYLRAGTCYVGISFYYDKTTPERDMFASLAQVFMDTGQGMVVRGDSFKWDVKKQGEPHLAQEIACSLLSDALGIYRLHHDNQSPNRVVIHKSSRYLDAEVSGFLEASREVPRFDFVTLSDGRDVFFYRNGENPTLRGTCIQLGKSSYLMYTKGYTPYLRAYLGPRVPRPLEITEHHGDTSLEELAKEIIALTRLNWNTTDYSCYKPITIEFSERVGEILGRVKAGTKIQNQYRYYM